MTIAFIAKPKHTSIAVQQLGCLAFTQETQVRFPAIEMFPCLFPFLILRHYLTKFCLFFSLFSSLVFPSYDCSHHYQFLLFDNWIWSKGRKEKQKWFTLLTVCTSLIISNKCSTWFRRAIMHNTSIYSICISWEKFCC